MLMEKILEIGIGIILPIAIIGFIVAFVYKKFKTQIDYVFNLIVRRLKKNGRTNSERN